MKLKGFTPLYDDMVERYGLITAGVYGKIWRYCDWSELDVCTASNKRLADELDVSESSVKRAKATLAEDGWIRTVGRSGTTDSITVLHEGVLDGRLIKNPTDEPVEEKKTDYKPQGKKGDLVDGMLDTSGHPDLDWMWPDTQDKLTELPLKWRTDLSNSMKKRYNTHVRLEWENYSVKDVRKAVDMHKKAGLSFGGPWSLDYAFKNLDEAETETEKRKRELHGD